MAVAAFWIGLAAVLIAGSWRSKVTDQMRHETVRLLIERGSGVEDQQVRDLLNPPVQPLPEGHPWNRRPAPGSGRKVLRVCGAIVTVASIGVGLMVGGVQYVEGLEDAAILGFSVGGGMFVMGLSLFFAAMFFDGPSDSE